MRQAGVIAAAGIVALEQMVDRLAEDHANACAVAAGLAELPGLRVDEVPVRTNIIYFETMRPDVDAACLVTRLEEAGVRMGAVGRRRIRAVLNYHVTATDVPATLDVMRAALGVDHFREDEMIALEDVRRARVQIAPYVKRTTLERSATLSRELGANVYLKLELFQKTGSFEPAGRVQPDPATDTRPAETRRGRGERRELCPGAGLCRPGA